jgi:undecaprenyl diphosphate synthase
VLPKHIAIIMDGNGRWAQAKARPRTFGHIKGARVAKSIITACAKKKIEYLTLYAFSTENWLRPANEVVFLMTLLRRYLKKETDTLVRQNIRFQVVGDMNRIPTDILKAIQYATEITKNNTGMTLVFALSYGARQELSLAVQKLAQQVQSGNLLPSEIDESLIQSNLQTYSMPDPDLIIRTSGEQRLSNFFLWQAAYSELYFTDTLWPDFKDFDLDLAIIDFLKRKRRFGKIEEIHENSAH